MNTSLAQQRRFLPSRRQAGLSLVELMISITIGMVLLVGLTTLLVQQSSTHSELEKASRQIENGRYAMQLLHDDIQLAGVYGEYSPASGTAVTYATPDPCVTVSSPGWTNTSPDVPVPIFGYTAAATSPTCITDRLAGTAILVVRRTATAPIPVSSAVAGTTYIQVPRCNKEAIPFVVSSDVSAFTLHQKDCSSPSPLRKYIVRIYYISSCDVCGSDTIPTLKMVEFVDNTQTTLPLVEGIENMQFDYGVDNVAPTDGAPDSYSTAPAASDWKDVTAVRVHLLSRNIDTTPGYSDTKTYSLGGAGTVTPGGAYKRHAYSRLTRVVNVSARREIP